MVNEIREYLKAQGLADSDRNDLPSSSRTFSDGGQFRLEIPTINSIEAAEMVLKESEKRGITVNRITETWGMFRHPQEEIRQYVQLTKEYNCELIMSVGPRATYDTSPCALTPKGSSLGYRLRGQEQIVRAIEDILRGIELGVRGFVIYDEGLLFILGRMRNDGEIPSSVHFKVSAHCGHGNACSARVLEDLGANSINPVRDLQLPMMAAIRQSVVVPLDIHTDNPPESGGFIRFYEAHEIVRVASPVYLKAGNSILEKHGSATTADQAKRMIRQTSAMIELMQRQAPELRQSRKKREEQYV